MDAPRGGEDNVRVASQFNESLGRMLDAYDARRSADVAREKKSKDDHARFLAGFEALKREVVRPVFEAAAKLLAERGHGSSVAEQEFVVDGAGKVTEASISFRVEPAGMAEPAQADEARTLSLTTRHYNKTVWINAGKPLDAGGMAGSKGAYELERIDRQLVEDQVMKLVGAVMAGG